jgi:hypothetical protein
MTLEDAMKTMLKKRTLTTGALAIGGTVLALIFAMATGCIGGFTDDNVPEGDRCNPLDSHNECASGLVCTGQGPAPAVPYCPENYCCSVDSTGNLNSTNANCQPGCNGGAAAICNATKDPGACAVAAGMPPPSADGGTE